MHNALSFMSNIFECCAPTYFINSIKRPEYKSLFVNQRLDLFFTKKPVPMSHLHDSIVVVSRVFLCNVLSELMDQCMRENC